MYAESLHFQAAQGRAVVARFDGGTLTSDGGAVSLREVERATGILRQFAACFTNRRGPARIAQTVASLVAQRVYGLALGCENLNDHDAFRADPLLAGAGEKRRSYVRRAVARPRCGLGFRRQEHAQSPGADRRRVRGDGALQNESEQITPSAFRDSDDAVRSRNRPSILC